MIGKILISPLEKVGSSRYRLERTHHFFLAGIPFTIPAGYTYDGASVPTLIGLAWRVTAAKADSRVMRAALEHDWLCDNQPLGTTHVMAADRFRSVLVSAGLAPWRAAVMHRAVLLGGPRWNYRADERSQVASEDDGYAEGGDQ